MSYYERIDISCIIDVNMDEESQKKPKISKTDFVLMLVVAIFFDIVLALIQLIIIVGSVSAEVFNVVPLMLFFIWYTLKGISFANKKNSLTFFGCALIEFIPIINALPAWTAEVVLMYIFQKKDVLLAKAVGMVGGVAGITGSASAVVKTVGAKNIGRSLEQTSTNLRETEKNIRSNFSQLKDSQTPTVGNEVKRVSQFPVKKDEIPTNISRFPISRKEFGQRTKFTDNNQEETPTNITELTTASETSHNEDWIFRGDKAA
jgi:hypothetical protein